MPHRMMAALAAGMSISSAGWAQGGPIHSEPSLSARTQSRLAEAAIQICGSGAHRVAVAVARPDGVVTTLLSGDGVRRIVVEAAHRKAITAALVGFPTAALAKAEAEAPAYVAFLRSVEPKLAAIGGGLPIHSKGQLVGAIGVGGAAGPEADEACARAAIAKVMGND